MTQPPTHRNGSTPTVLLVHGAWTSTYFWAPTVEALATDGIDATAVPIQLRSLAADAAYLAAVATAIDGPVLLVGHGYGGTVITVAGAQATNVVGLVYVAGLVPDVGESCATVAVPAAAAGFVDALLPVSLGAAGDPTTEIHIRREHFARVFGPGLPAGFAASAAAAQTPVTSAALEEPAAAAAWRHLPNWYLITGLDRVVDPVVDPVGQRAMAERIGATIVTADVPHAAPTAAPEAIAGVIRTTLRHPPAKEFP